MIHEFAVEPEVMATWSHFQMLWADFSVSQGRFLVEYPGSWRKQVYTLAERLSAPARANSICSRLSAPAERTHRMVDPMGRAYDPQKSWVENATTDHRPNGCFRAVVVLEASPGSSQVISVGELERDREPWKVDRQDPNCPRMAEEMCRRVSPLLRHSSELVLVDRNFDHCEPRFVRPFEAFVGVRANWKRLELHTGKANCFDREHQKAIYQRNLELAVPSGVLLTVCFWPNTSDGQRLHPRFVLTERGGVHFDYGLDEGPGTTLVSLLDHKVFLELRKQYRPIPDPDNRKFGEPEVIEIRGRG